MRERTCSVTVAVAVIMLMTSGRVAAQGMEPPPVELPVPVTVGIRILGITEIDELHNAYVAEATIYASWTDPRLAFEPADGAPAERVYIGPAADQLLGTVWWPHFNAVNLIGSSTRHRLKAVVHADGTVAFRSRAQGRLSSPFDFRDFPFDRQRLVLSAESFSWDNRLVRLEADEGRTGFDDSFKIPEWNVVDVRHGVTEVLTSGEQYPHSRLTLEIEITRKLGFYLWKVIVPLLTLVVISWIVFWMQGESLARRSGVSLTALLTVVAYQFILSESLPRVAYLTFMDQVMLLAFISIAATLIVSFVVQTRVVQDRGWAERVDRVCRWAFPLVSGGVLAAMISSALM